MNRERKIIKWDAVICLLYLAAAVFAAFFRELINTDEVWNFTFALNISKGLLPYRDFNYLQTPLPALINGILFCIFGRHILVMRLAGAALFAAIGALLYKSGRLLGADRILAALPGFGVIMMFSTNIFFEYSDFILFLLLTLMGIDLAAAARGRISQPTALFASGILGGMAVLSKQTYGLFTAAASLVSLFILCLFLGKGVREAFRAAFFRLAGLLIPCLAFLIYLLASGTFDDFLDMCLYGISNFTAYYHYRGLFEEGPAFAAAAALMPACLALGAVFAIWRLARSRARSRSGILMLIILVYSCFGMINPVPLANKFHFEICSVPVMLAAILLYVQALAAGRGVRARKIRAFFRRIVSIAAFMANAAILFYILIYNTYDISRNLEFHTDIACFEGTFMGNALAGEIDEVDRFVEAERAQGHEVFVLDNKAEFYLAPLGIYHKYLDMFLNGNLGTVEPGQCLERSRRPGAVYLIPRRGRSNTQYPREAVEEFKNTLTPSGSLGDFEIYRVSGWQ